MATHRITRECSVAREAGRRVYWTNVAENVGKYDRPVMRINEANVNKHPSST